MIAFTKSRLSMLREVILDTREINRTLCLVGVEGDGEKKIKDGTWFLVWTINWTATKL